MGPFDRLKPGEFLSASQYNSLLARLEQLISINVSPPLQISRSQSGYSISMAGDAIAAGGGTRMVNVCTFVRNPDNHDLSFAKLTEVARWGTVPTTEYNGSQYPKLYLGALSPGFPLPDGNFADLFEADTFVWIKARREGSVGTNNSLWPMDRPDLVLGQTYSAIARGSIEASIDVHDEEVDWTTATYNLPVYETCDPPDRMYVWVTPIDSGDPPDPAMGYAGTEVAPSTGIVSGAATATHGRWSSFTGGRTITCFEQQNLLVTDSEIAVEARRSPDGSGDWIFPAPITGCKDVPELPEGYTDITACTTQQIGSRCNEGVTEYQRTIFFWTNPPTVYQSGWSSTVPPDPL